MIMLYIEEMELIAQNDFEEMNILYIGQFLRGVVFSFILHIFLACH